jgi:hypothetical protein
VVPMKQFKRVLTNGFFVLALYLIIIVGILVIVEMNPVSADLAPQPVYATLEDAPQSVYAPLEDAQQPAANDISTGRDITQQRFAPLEE